MALGQPLRIILSTSAYKLLQPVLANIDPERAHRGTIALLNRISKNNALIASVSKRYGERVPDLPVQLFGKSIRNPVGLAAGFDKNGVAYPALAALGFGFIEIGTVTPNPQPGNPKVRIFRLNKEHSIINRLGFNSSGLQNFLRNLTDLPGIPDNTLLGINIGRNSNTPNEAAHRDYGIGLESIYKFADYAVLNLSSPNSPGLRMLQNPAELTQLLQSVMHKRDELAEFHQDKLLPIAVKISPDLEARDIVSIAQIALEYRVDALIATNTSIARPDSITHKHYTETGGLSGKLLTNQSTAVIQQLAQVTRGQIPIIGVGGISSAKDAWDKLLAGATAVQLYTAMVYQGPAIVGRIVSGLTEIAKEYDSTSLATAIERARQQS